MSECSDIESENPVVPLLKKEPRPTPQTTVEALMFEFRSHRLEALSTADNKRRLLDCDEAAMTQIAKRLSKLPLHAPWPLEQIEKLIRYRVALAVEEGRQ